MSDKGASLAPRAMHLKVGSDRILLLSGLVCLEPFLVCGGDDILHVLVLESTHDAKEEVPLWHLTRELVWFWKVFLRVGSCIASSYIFFTEIS